MKTFTAALLAAGLFACAVAPAEASSVCIQTRDIDHTTAPDMHTILFHMRNGTVWRNTLKNDCPNIQTNGFIYAPTPPDTVCENLQSIRVIHTGAVCLLGAFTKEPPKPASPM